MKLLILFNPAAGRGSAGRKLPEVMSVLRANGIRPEIRESQSTEHLRELAHQAWAGQPDIVVSAGGDGTHHHVLDQLWGSEVPLGMIPLGTGNDLSDGIGVPRDLRQATAALLRGKTKQIDLGRVGSNVFGGMAGVGLDSMVARYVNERAQKIPGRLAYVWAILRCLKVYQPPSVDVRADGFSFSGGVIAVLVGNLPFYGGGLRITPHARADDGLLDVCLIPAMRKVRLLPWIPRVYRGTHLAHPRIHYFQTQRVTLSSSVFLNLYGDGEFIQALPATIEVVPRAVRVIVP